MGGFVYIWRDSKHNRYYIGCHWGSPDDGYICSSSWMKKSYERRPQNFRRRILENVLLREHLFQREAFWLSLIKDNEFGKKFYNLRRNFVHWSADEAKRLTVREKISKANKGRVSTNKGKRMSDEQKKKISHTLKTYMSSEEVRANISAKLKGRPLSYIRTEETRAKISTNNKRLIKEGRIGTTGKHHSSKTKELMSKNNAMNNPLYREKAKAAKQGIRWMTDGISRKMAVPGSDKFNKLVEEGYWAY